VANPVRTKILLVDDHRIVRQGVRLILEQTADMTVVGEAADAAEALAKAVEFQPDIVVMDIHLPAIDGIDACRRILAAQPAARVIVLSSDSGREVAERALQSGASGYVVKEAAGDELVRAIHTVLAGRLYLCPEITTELIRVRGMQEVPRSSSELTDRDRELIRLIAAGLRNKEIAEHLGLSVKAVEANRSRVMARLGCSSAAELVRYAVRTGIAPP